MTLLIIIKYITYLTSITCSFVGCDSTSAFAGKGKVKPWKLLLENPEFLEPFSLLGQSFEISEEVSTPLNRFVCLLYGDKKGTCVNDSR